MDMKVEEAKKVAHKKHGRRRNVEGQQLKVKKGSTFKPLRRRFKIWKQ